MTPISYARWQHAQRQEADPVKRHNPLYDTPPTVRQAHLRLEGQQRPGGQGPVSLRLQGEEEVRVDDCWHTCVLNTSLRKDSS